MCNVFYSPPLQKYFSKSAQYHFGHRKSYSKLVTYSKIITSNAKMQTFLTSDRSNLLLLRILLITKGSFSTGFLCSYFSHQLVYAACLGLNGCNDRAQSGGPGIPEVKIFLNGIDLPRGSTIRKPEFARYFV